MGAEVKAQHAEHDGGGQRDDGSQRPVEPKGGGQEHLVEHAHKGEEPVADDVESTGAGDGQDHEPGQDASPHKQMLERVPVECVQCNLKRWRNKYTCTCTCTCMYTF